MRYGSFNDEKREYVINRPDTPRTWLNYIGSRLYGGIITQNAGGYSFYKSGGSGRILRMRFNSVPNDEPGRYLYLRDDNDGDYWSASWQPVGKPLDQYQSTVKHGLGYSIFEAKYRNIQSSFTCFIPQGQAFEYWVLDITNTDSQNRNLSIFSYGEVTNNFHFRQDLENLQFSQYTVKMSVQPQNGIIHRSSSNLPDAPADNPTDDVYFALVDAKIESYDTDRDIFIGPYHTLANPQSVVQGYCKNSVAVGDNGCTSIHTKISLAPGESKSFIFILGVGHPDISKGNLPSGKEIIKSFGNRLRMEQELEAIRSNWAEQLSSFQVQTPDPEMNSMLNVWHAYQTHMAFNWSRGVSLVEAGGRDGLGYRDTVQDMLSVTHAIPAQVEERLDLMLTGQLSHGGAMPLINQNNHRPGQEKGPHEDEYRSDDALWLPITISDFIFETGKLDYLDKVLPYADKGSATVFGHLKQALQFSLDHRGNHGLMLGLHADWNDCIRGGKEGQSLFSTYLFYHGCLLTAELADSKGLSAEAEWCRQQAENIRAINNKYAWDGEWFLRVLSGNGGRLGTKDDDEGKIWLESNVWAIISGIASPEQATSTMNSIHNYLATEHGILLCEPAHTKIHPTVHLPLLLYPPGHKENAGIFCHSNSWVIMAAAILGRGDQAYEYYRSYLPARYNDIAEIHQMEPYVYCQFTYGRSSPRFGQARNPWLTGTASWTYIAATQYILGIYPKLTGLQIDPCIPSKWNGYTVHRRFRGKWLTIKVSNPNHVNKGVKSITLNGMAIQGMIIPSDKLLDKNEVEVVLG
jgi:N,N'-diacetylchitobiose phosphorylase